MRCRCRIRNHGVFLQSTSRLSLRPPAVRLAFRRARRQSFLSVQHRTSVHTQCVQHGGKTECASASLYQTISCISVWPSGTLLVQTENGEFEFQSGNTYSTTCDDTDTRPLQNGHIAERVPAPGLLSTQKTKTTADAFQQTLCELDSNLFDVLFPVSTHRPKWLSTACRRLERCHPTFRS